MAGKQKVAVSRMVALLLLLAVCTLQASAVVAIRGGEGIFVVDDEGFEDADLERHFSDLLSQNEARDEPEVPASTPKEPEDNASAPPEAEDNIEVPPSEPHETRVNTSAPPMVDGTIKVAGQIEAEYHATYWGRVAVLSIFAAVCGVMVSWAACGTAIRSAAAARAMRREIAASVKRASHALESNDPGGLWRELHATVLPDHDVWRTGHALVQRRVELQRLCAAAVAQFVDSGDAGAAGSSASESKGDEAAGGSGAAVAAEEGEDSEQVPFESVGHALEMIEQWLSETEQQCDDLRNGDARLLNVARATEEELKQCARSLRQRVASLLSLVNDAVTAQDVGALTTLSRDVDVLGVEFDPSLRQSIARRFEVAPRHLTDAQSLSVLAQHIALQRLGGAAGSSGRLAIEGGASPVDGSVESDATTRSARQLSGTAIVSSPVPRSASFPGDSSTALAVASGADADTLSGMNDPAVRELLQSGLVAGASEAVVATTVIGGALDLRNRLLMHKIEESARQKADDEKYRRKVRDERDKELRKQRAAAERREQELADQQRELARVAAERAEEKCRTLDWSAFYRVLGVSVASWFVVVVVVFYDDLKLTEILVPSCAPPTEAVEGSDDPTASDASAGWFGFSAASVTSAITEAVGSVIPSMSTITCGFRIAVVYILHVLVGGLALFLSNMLLPRQAMVGVVASMGAWLTRGVWRHMVGRLPFALVIPACSVAVLAYLRWSAKRGSTSWAWRGIDWRLVFVYAGWPLLAAVVGVLAGLLVACDSPVECAARWFEE